MTVGFPPGRNSLSNKTTRKAVLGKPPHFQAIPSDPFFAHHLFPISPERCLCHAGTQGHHPRCSPSFPTGFADPDPI